MGVTNSTLTPAQRIRLLGARSVLDDAARDELGRLIAGPVDWARILASLRQDGTAALFDHHLAAAPGVADGMPQAVRAALRRAALGSWARARTLAAGWREALAALDAASVPAITLKGMALAHRVYADASLRPMADIDLLVHLEDASAAREALARAGFRAPDGVLADEWTLRGALPLVRGPIVIDLHWHAARYPRYEHAIAVDHAGLWRRAREEWLGDTTARVLAVEDELLHVALHLSIGSEFGRLVWFTDIDALVRRRGAAVDWDVVRARAQAWRISGLVAFVLDVARASLATPVPRDAVGSAGPGIVRRRLVRRLLDGERPPSLAWREPSLRVYPAEALLMDRRRDALRVAANAVVPPLAWIASHYGVTGWRRHLYRAFHPLRVGGVAARALLRRGRSPGAVAPG